MRFVAVVDMRGRIVGDEAARSQVTGLREGEMKLVGAATVSSSLYVGTKADDRYRYLGPCRLHT